MKSKTKSLRSLARLKATTILARVKKAIGTRYQTVLNDIYENQFLNL